MHCIQPSKCYFIYQLIYETLWLDHNRTFWKLQLLQIEKLCYDKIKVFDAQNKPSFEIWKFNLKVNEFSDKVKMFQT